MLENNIDKVFDFFSKWEKIVDGIIIKQDSRTIVRETNTHCVWPYNGLFISYQGIVSACCMDVNHEYIIGDTNINTLEEIFNSQKIMSLQIGLFYLGNISLSPLFGILAQETSFLILPYFLIGMLILFTFLNEVVNRITFKYQAKRQ